MRATVASLLTGVASAASLYTPTPGGYVLSHCVHSVPSGAVLERTEAGMTVTHEAGTYTIPKCDATVNGVKVPVMVRSSEAARAFTTAALTKTNVRGDASRRLQFPPDYDGWLEYAAFSSTDSFDVFTGKMSVPNTPASPPDVLYIFPGLQNIDWIPIVDPEPSGPFDIIQPVLQYPGDSGLYWSVKSWWVTLDIGAMASAEVPLSVGDTVFGNMTRLSSAAYVIDSVSTTSGKHTSIVARGLGARLDSQPWAYVTLECYGCTSCSTYPTGNSAEAFTELFLSQKGVHVTPTWRANPKPSKNRVCKEDINIASPTDVTITFGN